MGTLTGKVALVTGAASGIGLACAERFAADGASVVGMDLAAAPDAWQQIGEISSSTAFHIGDVVDEERVQGVVADTLSRFNRIDILVNAAGVAGGGPVHMVDSADWDRVIDINLKGTFLVSKHVLAASMIEKGSGSIVNIASVEGLEANEGGSAYNASKGGVVLLTKNMSIDYGRNGIRVNAICPGFIDTPLLRNVFDGEGMQEFLNKIIDSHQLGRLGKPEEIASAAAFLAGDDASFITGHSLAVDGGFMAGKRFGFSKMMGLE